MFAWEAGVEYVIVPIEHRFSGILQELKETGFYSIQHVEADKYIAVVAQSVGVELLHDIAVHHAFVGDAQFCKIAAVVAVDVAQFIPEGDEFCFQLRALFYGEILEEEAFVSEQRAYCQGYVDCIQLLAGLGLLKKSTDMEKIISEMKSN